MCHLTQTKHGVSSIELDRRVGVMQTTAWTIKHKLAKVTLERDAGQLLAEWVEIDDAQLGGERPGGELAEARNVCGWGHGILGKMPFVAAVETTPDGKSICLKLSRIVSFCSASLSSFAKRSPDPAANAARYGEPAR